MNKTVQKVMFSSKTGEWSTPQDFFDKLNARFKFRVLKNSKFDHVTNLNYPDRF